MILPSHASELRYCRLFKVAEKLAHYFHFILFTTFSILFYLFFIGIASLTFFQFLFLPSMPINLTIFQSTLSLPASLMQPLMTPLLNQSK